MTAGGIPLLSTLLLNLQCTQYTLDYAYIHLSIPTYHRWLWLSKLPATNTLVILGAPQGNLYNLKLTHDLVKVLLCFLKLHATLNFLNIFTYLLLLYGKYAKGLQATDACSAKHKYVNLQLS